MTDIPTIQATVIDDPEHEARVLQGLSEGVVVDVDTVELLGEKFRVSDRVGLMPLMKFAASAKKGAQSDDMEGLVAMLNMLKDCIIPGDWDRFEAHATEQKANDEELMAVVTRTMEILSARPTQRRSGSSSGRPSTSPSSTDGSSPQRRPRGVEDLVPVEDLGKVLASA